MQIEIFKAGTHTDSAGNTRQWSAADLDAIAQKYNGQPVDRRHEAPVVIGHPKDNAPAYGWVEGLERKGGVLYARLKDLAPEFVEWVKKGLYRKRSISLYPDMTLRHIGFLGAMPPAIKGLADAAFSSAPGVTIDFDEAGAINAIGYIFQRMRDWLIGKFGQDSADQVLDQYSIDMLKNLPPDDETGGDTVAPLYMERESVRAIPVRAIHESPQQKESKESEMERKELEAKLSEFSGQLKARDEEVSRLKATLDAETKARRTAEFNTFCDGLITEGRLVPAQKPLVMDFMEIAHAAGEYEFAEGKKAALDRMKEFLSGLPKQVEFGEMATKGRAVDGASGPKTSAGDYPGQVDEERMKLHEKALEYMEKHDGVTYMAAMQTVIREA